MVVNRDSLITHSFQLFFIGYLRYNISTVGLRLLPTVVPCDVLPLPQIYEVHCTRNVYGLSCWNCFAPSLTSLKPKSLPWNLFCIFVSSPRPGEFSRPARRLPSLGGCACRHMCTSRWCLLVRVRQATSTGHRLVPSAAL